MKRFILELYPAYTRYKGHRQAIEFIALKIAEFNGGIYSGDTQQFIKTLGSEINGISIDSIEQVNFNIKHYIGSNKTDGNTVIYGIIYEIILK